MTKQEKEQLVAELVDKMGRMKSLVFTSVSGFTMTDANDLRAKGKVQGVEAKVAKKTLLLRALQAANLSVDPAALSGSILAAFGFTDEIAPAKLVAELGKTKEGIKMVGGILEGRFVDAAAVSALALLPGRQELLAKMVGSLNAPVSGFVNVLAGNLRGFVRVLNAIKEAKA